MSIDYKMINVTKTFLPPKAEYDKYLDRIWASNWITNKGPLSAELEKKLADYLNVKHIILVSNGTIALQLLYKALGLKNKVITTPFSYVATTSSIVWEGLEPIFCDIDPETLCPDFKAIQQALENDSSISAIVLTHVYGNSGPLEEYQQLADKYNIPLIYDAAHSFNVKYNNQSILNFGKAATLSFHATKLFHTIEGGAIATNDEELAAKVEYMRRFGHDEMGGFFGLGINAKSSEFNAAMGLAVLPYVSEIIEKRKAIFEIYDRYLTGKVIPLNWNEALDQNYAYYPVFLKSEPDVLKVKDFLQKKDIHLRRYFHPSLNQLPYV
ncbi:MAG: DegT/DnrJ/EryC1/StrS family aminotransferase, partial [Chitinophagales bacterium]